jgi:hypothetical protein
VIRPARHLVAALLLVLAPAALGYESAVHQAFTFLAAKQFNRCIENTPVAPLTPLQVRYIARSNVAQSEVNPFVRMFRWSYYDRSEEAERTAFWLIDTRFHGQFNERVRRLEKAQDEVAAYKEFGRIVSFLQQVTSPPRVVPVYTGRFWRLSFSDRFDSFPVDELALNQAVAQDCSFLEAVKEDYHAILSTTARDTLAAVVEPISGMPVSWQVFWTLADEQRSFGEYGSAGNNFGRKVEFRCGDERCLLLKDDPLYREFALARHLQAVRATMAAMYLSQRHNAAFAER